MRPWLLLPALALLASCSFLPDRPEGNTDGAYAQARNQACLLEAQRNLKFGKYAEALATFERWYGSVEDPVAHLTLARIHLGLGDRDRALEALEAAAELVPDSTRLQDLLARFEMPLRSPSQRAEAESAALPASLPKGFVTLE